MKIHGTSIGLLFFFLLLGCSTKDKSIRLSYKKSGYIRCDYIKGQELNGQTYINGRYREYYPIEGRQLKHQWAYQDKKVHGEMTFYYDSGQLRRKYNFVQGAFEGAYQEFFANGVTKVRGLYESGLRHEQWEGWYEDKSIHWRRFYLNGVPEGEWVEFYLNGYQKTKRVFEGGKETEIREFTEEFILTKLCMSHLGELVDYKLDYHEEKWPNGKLKLAYSRTTQGPLLGANVGYEKEWNEGGKLIRICRYEKGINVDEKHYSNMGILVKRKQTKDGHKYILELFYQDGKPRQYSEYKDGKKDGERKYWYENGKLSQEEFYRNDKLHKTYKEFDLKGTLRLSIEYKDGLKHGKTQLYYANGKKQELRSYKNDKFHGPQTLWYENQKPEQVSSYKDGAEEGVWISYFKNGQKKAETTFQKGKKNGLFKEYYDNGRVKRESNFKWDKQNGLEKVFNKQGKLLEEANWEDGKYHGVRTFHSPTGMVLRTVAYKEGKKNGPGKSWYANGRKKAEYSYRKDKLYGKHIVFWPNSRKMRECNYRAGEIEGYCYYFDKSGKEVYDKKAKDNIEKVANMELR